LLSTLSPFILEKTLFKEIIDLIVFVLFINLALSEDIKESLFWFFELFDILFGDILLLFLLLLFLEIKFCKL
jgi:hypothetical protein